MSCRFQYRDLQRKTAKDLRDICRQEDLAADGRKVELLSRLVDHFEFESGPSIKVTDSFDILGRNLPPEVLNSYKRLPKFHRIHQGWTKDIRNIPPFDLDKLKSYLIYSNNKCYDDGSLRAYKALQAYKHYWAGHVHSVEFNMYRESDYFCFVRGKCNPSQDATGKQYSVTLCLEKTGEVLGAHCQCVAGLGEACTHAAALMFALEDFVAKGYRTLPDGKSCTDILCYWTAARNSHVEPRPISEIDFSNPVFGKEKRSSSIKPHEVLSKQPRRNDARYRERVNDLKRKLEESVPGCDFLSHFQLSSPEVPEVECEESVTTSSRRIETEPADLSVSPPVVSPCENPAIARDSLNVTRHKQEAIELMTRGQASNPLWFENKKGRITASICKDVFTFGTRTHNPERLTNKIMQKAKPVRTAAMRYGIENEDTAVKKYEAFIGVKTEESGLVVDLDHGEIACSPDRLVCGSLTKEPGLVEVKCLFSCRDKIVRDAVKLNEEKTDFPFHLENDADVTIKRTHKYYYQVQMQMAITKRHWCDVVIFTHEECDVEIVRVTFDPEFWSRVQSKLLSFHKLYIQPLL